MRRRDTLKWVMCLFPFVGGQSLAHSDLVVSIDMDGTLRGLPPGFERAHFDGRTGELTVNDRRFRVPDCVAEFIPEMEREVLYGLYGSWLHDLPSHPPFIPPYLTLGYGSYSVELNLNTLEPRMVFMETRQYDHGELVESVTDASCRAAMNL